MPTATADRAMSFQPDETFAKRLDAEDPLRVYRDEFHVPADAIALVVLAGPTNGIGRAARRSAATILA